MSRTASLPETSGGPENAYTHTSCMSRVLKKTEGLEDVGTLLTQDVCPFSNFVSPRDCDPFDQVYLRLIATRKGSLDLLEAALCESPVTRLTKAQATNRWFRKSSSAAMDALKLNWELFHNVQLEPEAGHEPDTATELSVHCRILGTTSWARGIRSKESQKAAFDTCHGMLLEEVDGARMQHRRNLLMHPGIRQIRNEVQSVIKARFREVTDNPSARHPFQWWDCIKVSKRALPSVELKLGQRHAELRQLRNGQENKLKSFRRHIETRKEVVNNPSGATNKKLVSTEISTIVTQLLEVSL
jgi:hypothetical protein